MPSGVMLNVASSTSVLMAVIMSRRSFASLILALNKVSRWAPLSIV
jgi:hypothetical protein